MPQLDGLRFLAVSLVMFGHWTEAMPALHKFDLYAASFGVNLFFVLSGFLIAQILILNKKSEESPVNILRTFYVRRFLRIFPLYYAVVFGCLMLRVPFARPYYESLITYTVNYPIALGDNLYYMTHLWSLSVEEQFYIFFPFLILFLPSKYQMKTFIALVALALFFRLAVSIAPIDRSKAWWICYGFTPGCLDCFGLGAIIAYLRVNNREYLQKLLSKKILLWVSLFVYMLLVFYEVRFPNNIISMALIRLSCSVCCFFIIGLASESLIAGLPKLILQAKPVIYLGKISYGLYVYHHFMPWVFLHFRVANEQVFYLPVTILVSALSWHLFESPINNLKNKFNYFTIKKSLA